MTRSSHSTAEHFQNLHPVPSFTLAATQRVALRRKPPRTLPPPPFMAPLAFHPAVSHRQKVWRHGLRPQSGSGDGVFARRDASENLSALLKAGSRCACPAVQDACVYASTLDSSSSSALPTLNSLSLFRMVRMLMDSILAACVRLPPHFSSAAMM